MPPSAKTRVIISYAHRDGAQLAERLQRDLTASGLDTWLDKQRLHGGAVWTTEVEREIDTLRQESPLLRHFNNRPAKATGRT